MLQIGIILLESCGALERISVQPGEDMGVIENVVIAIAKRKLLAKRYRELLSNIDGLILNCEQKDVEYNYGYFPIRIDYKVFGKSREEVYERLL